MLTGGPTSRWKARTRSTGERKAHSANCCITSTYLHSENCLTINLTIKQLRSPTTSACEPLCKVTPGYEPGWDGRSDFTRDFIPREPGRAEHPLSKLLHHQHIPTHATRWTTDLSSKVNLPDAINFKAFCGITKCHVNPINLGGRSVCSPPVGVR